MLPKLRILDGQKFTQQLLSKKVVPEDGASARPGARVVAADQEAVGLLDQNAQPKPQEKRKRSGKSVKEASKASEQGALQPVEAMSNLTEANPNTAGKSFFARINCILLKCGDV